MILCAHTHGDSLNENDVIKNKKIGKERDSNFELLRIFAIFMIIVSHFCYHGGVLENVVSEKITTNLIITQILYFQNWTISVFIMITGYFMIKSKANYKKIINLIIEMFFYSIVFMGIFYGLNIVKFDIKRCISNIFPIFWSGNWFVKYYIILYLLIPYLNIFIEKLSKEQLQKVIVLFLIIFSIISTITHNAWNFTWHNIFILDYIIGAYIRLYPIKKLENNKINIISLLLITILSLVFSVTCMLLSKILDVSILFKIPGALINSFSSPVPILIAFFIFHLFKNIKIKSKLINYIASSTLGIYLVHDNSFIRDWIWKTLVPNANFLGLNTLLYILFMLAKVAIVFLVSVAVDKIRIILLQKLEDKLSNKIYNILLNFKNFIKRKVYNKITL